MEIASTTASIVICMVVIGEYKVFVGRLWKEGLVMRGGVAVLRGSVGKVVDLYVYTHGRGGLE